MSATQTSKRTERRLLRLPEVEHRTGRRHAAIYEAIANGTFPAPVPLGARAVGWLEDEVDAWIEARIVDRDSGTAARSRPLAGKPSKEQHE
jgi:prophage regulatory protein